MSFRISRAALAALAVAGLLGFGSSSAFAEEVDPEAAVSMRVTAYSLPSLAPGQTYPNANVVSVDPVSGVLPANAGTMIFTITGPATVGTTAIYSVSPNGSRNLSGCGARGTQTITCTGGTPWQTSGGNYNHIRLPLAIDSDALPGDIVTVTSELVTQAAYPNSNPQKSDTGSGSIPLTAPSIDPSGILNSTPTITGSGVPEGATVGVSVAGRPAEVVPVGPDGTWTLTITDPLPNGVSTVSAVQYRNGFTSPTATGSITVDAIPPGEPMLDLPTDGSLLITSTPTFSGTGEDGSTIEVRDETDVVVCSAPVIGGTWSCTPSSPLDDGVRTFHPAAIDGVGNETEGADTTVTIDTTPPDAAVITSPAEGSAINDPTPTFGVTGEPGATVELRDADGTVICSVVVPVSGQWSCTPTTALPEGPQTITPVITDPAGYETIGDPISFIVDLTPPPAPVDVACDENANGTVTCSGTGTPGDTVVIRDSSGAVVCETVITSPTWSCTTIAPIAGDVTAEYVDPAGNTSTAVSVSVTPYDPGTADGGSAGDSNAGSAANGAGTAASAAGGAQGTSGAHGSLPTTGAADFSGMLLVALGLLGLGTAVFATVARKQRSSTASP